MADESKLKAQAREWLEMYTPLRWCTEPREGDPVDEPIENLNRRPQQWADRLAAFAREQVKAETADLRDRLADAEKALQALLEIPYTEYLHQPTAITMTGYAIQYRDKYGFGNEKNNSPKLQEVK